MTNQEIFTKVKRHLLKQKGKAYCNDERVCYYRLGELRCAVGCLIPKNKYDSRIEGMPIPLNFEYDDEDYQPLNNILKGLKIYKRSYPLLKDLQSVHDNYAVDKWKEELRKVATEYRLKY